MRTTEDELSMGNQTSLPLPQGGFMAWLGVYHELHCIVSNFSPFRTNSLTNSLPSILRFFRFYVIRSPSLLTKVINQKMLRQFKYLDHYHSDIVPGSTQHAHLSVHADHCIEMLRQSALCHADGSLTTFKWSSTAAKPMLDLTRPVHKCVNWNTLTDSLQDRIVGQEEMDLMTNPDFHGREGNEGAASRN